MVSKTTSNTASTLISQATSQLRRLSKSRNSGLVNADDVQNFLTRKGFSGSQNQRLSITRQVLGNTNFVSLGIMRSNRPEARGRFITAWVAR